MAKDTKKLDILPDSAEIPDHIVLPLGSELAGHKCRVEMKVSTLNEVLSENDSYFSVSKE